MPATTNSTAAGVHYHFGDAGSNSFVAYDVPGIQVGQNWNAATDTVLLTGSGFTSFADVISHSYRNCATSLCR